MLFVLRIAGAFLTLRTINASSILHDICTAGIHMPGALLALQLVEFT